MKTLFAGLCLVFTTLFSCQQKEGQFKSVSVDDFSTLIANPEVQLLDVRTVAEYSEGHVPHSININVLMSRLKRWPTPLCRRTNRLQYIVVVVSVVKGRCHTEQKGYIIYDLDKGFIGWEEAGKEVEK